MDDPDGQRPRRLGNPLQWRMADRCLAIAVVMCSSTAVVLITTLLGGWPFIDDGASRVASLRGMVAGALAAWLFLGGVARWRREREGAGTGLASATIVLYAFTLALFTLATGPFAAAGWIAGLGGVVVGYVLFPRWLSLGGLVLYLALVIGGAGAIAAGWFDGTALAPVANAVRIDGAGVVRNSVAAVSLAMLTIAVVVFVVERWRDREESFARMAATDDLTGLTNRRQLFVLAERELARGRRYRTPSSLVLVDLDHFKAVNDRHGHVIGDAVLSHTAAVLAGAVRDVDTVARYGGEEFAILLPMTAADGAVEVAERCRKRLSETPYLAGAAGPIAMTASFGVAETTGGDVDDVLRRADTAMYDAKAAGRDRVVRG